MLRLIFCLHLNVGGGHAVLPNSFGRKSPARDPEAAQFSAKLFLVTAGIDQRAKGHVTANAGKTVEIGEFHGMPPCGWDCCLKRLSARCRLILSAEREGVKRWR